MAICRRRRSVITFLGLPVLQQAQACSLNLLARLSAFFELTNSRFLSDGHGLPDLDLSDGFLKPEKSIIPGSKREWETLQGTWPDETG